MMTTARKIITMISTGTGVRYPNAPRKLATAFPPVNFR